MSQPAIIPADVSILRDLARRILDISRNDTNLARRQRWYDHNALKPGQPMLLAETGGLWKNSEHPVAGQIQCQGEWARDLERQFRSVIYQFEHVGDDTVVEPYLDCGWRVTASDYGVKTDYSHGSADGHLGSFVWQPPLKNLQEDFGKLRPRTFTVDREATMARKAQLESILGDILPVRIRGSHWWTFGLTINIIALIGLEQLMLYMVDDPEGLHRIMKFMMDDHLAFARWLEREGLLTLNNENDYIGSGSVAYTHELPRPNMNGHVRLQDLWCLSESQETVGVGPEMFAEFIFPYQKQLIEHFGMSYYGCCEPVHSRWHVIRQISNLRKVSISPWCDQAMMARELGSRWVFCRKPNPTLISTDRFDEEAIRRDLRETLTHTRKHNCLVELVMKDVHTLQRQPERLGRWVRIAREQCDATT